MESNQAAAGFSALSQETRLRLMRLLAAQGASGMPAGELAARLGLPPSTLSFHLAALEQAGLIRSTRQRPPDHLRGADRRPARAASAS